MTQTALRSFYEQRKTVFISSLQRTSRRINIVSNLRLLTAIIFIALSYFGLKNHDILYSLPFFLLVFVLLVRRHAAFYREKVHLENLIDIQRNEIGGLEGDVSSNSSGSDFVNVHHPYTHDLDIFGEGSLFQYINRSNTRGGKSMLADQLSSRPQACESIRMRQEAISELAVKSDFRQEVQALSKQIDEQPQDEHQLKQWLLQPAFIFGKSSYRIILSVLPAITVGLVILAFIVEGVTIFAVSAATLQWIFLGFHLKRVNAFHQYISRKKNLLEKYAGMLGLVGNEVYSSSLMRSLGIRAQEADESVKKLATLVSAFDARLNSMTNLFVNSLLLYDLQCVYRLEEWKSKNAAHLPDWLSLIHEMEVLCSVGTFAFNHPQFVFPSVSEGLTLSAQGLAHPMLKETERVANDVHLDPEQSVLIITGANMAGKSTFLRSLGVNVVLALTGAPVCAKQFVCPLIGIRSGMRTADSLKESQSYFYAELDRLKSIMEELRRGQPLLILLDEILKGTNSTDKQTGSLALVRQLVTESCLVVIATHDLALGELAKLYPQKIRNFSFEANIENDQLFFDYKLKPGVAKKMNATFLMRKMGIIPE